MLVIKDNTNLFNPKEKEILEKKCISFIPDKSNKKYYIRQHISNDDIEFKTIIDKIKDYVVKLLKRDIKLEKLWINKITNDTKRTGRFHYDLSDITFIMYLNDNFTGGEYEYVLAKTNEVKIIKPEKYLSIISDKCVNHRVNPVIDGERYGIVFFYYFDIKVNKTLI
jgi:hypothetical protein